MIEEQDITQYVDEKIEQDGVVAMKVTDGEVFVFTDVTLRKLLAQAEGSPEKKAIVFIPFVRTETV